VSDFEFILPSTSKAIVGSEEAMHLLEQIRRVENSVAKNDSALTLDTSKALLETTYKTILEDRGENFNASDDMNLLYKTIKEILPFNHDDEAKGMLEKLTGTIAHWVPQLRNKFGASSHGKDGHYICPIEMPEAEMVAYLVDGVSGFLLRKNRILANPENSQRIYYADYEEFNEYLDTSNDPLDLKISDSTPIPYSLFLFDYDRQAYKEGLIQFLTKEEGDEQSTFEITPQPESTEPVPDTENHLEQTDIYFEGLDALVNQLFIDDKSRISITRDQAVSIAEFVANYAKNDAGVDWQNRESLIARFRMILRKKLIRNKYSKTFIDQTVEGLISKAAELFPNEQGGQ